MSEDASAEVQREGPPDRSMTASEPSISSLLWSNPLDGTTRIFQGGTETPFRLTVLFPSWGGITPTIPPAASSRSAQSRLLIAHGLFPRTPRGDECCLPVKGSNFGAIRR